MDNKKFAIKDVLPTLETLVFAGIFTINCLNYDKSPLYIENGKRLDGILLKLIVNNLIKGLIYGMFVPISLCGIFLGLIDGGHSFTKHFIPFSVYRIF